MWGYSVFGFLTILFEKSQPGEQAYSEMLGFGDPSYSKVDFRINETRQTGAGGNHTYRVGLVQQKPSFFGKTRFLIVFCTLLFI